MVCCVLISHLLHRQAVAATVHEQCLLVDYENGRRIGASTHYHYHHHRYHSYENGVSQTVLLCLQGGMRGVEIQILNQEDHQEDHQENHQEDQEEGR